MLIKLTNASKQLSDEPILVNLDMAVSIYQDKKIDRDGNEDRITCIFMPPHGTWEVRETPEEIAELIKGTNNGN